MTNIQFQLEEVQGRLLEVGAVLKFASNPKASPHGINESAKGGLVWLEGTVARIDAMIQAEKCAEQSASLV